ncbi:hypothetical protein B0H14DRAFT_3425763 [Mycena olivaceomarginata]|nr:hypothetical protein B0H14DRAFT_3425763 [Mycena olivaceomarginata]
MYWLVDSDVDIDFFADTAPGPLPLLETLTIRAETAENRVPFPDAQIPRLLHLAPNLVQCTFHKRLVDYHFRSLDHFASRQPLAHTHLRRLSVA